MLSQDVVENQKRVKDARKSMLDKTTGKEPTLESAISHSRVISTDMTSQGLEDKEESIKQALPSNDSSAVPSQKSVISNGNQPSSTGCLDKESGQSDDSVISGAMKTLSLDDNSSSKRSRVESLQQAQDPNQIPDGFISDVQDPMRYFFLGYYAGDGCFGRHFLRRFRIILKACEFVPLYKMLARCGVASPDFRFMKQNYISVKYSAGYAGSVRWSPRSSRESSSSISDLGLPSSGAVCSDAGLLKSLIPDTDPEEKSQLFLLLILGYTVADGTVIWKYRRTAQGIIIRYGGIQLYSTDLGFL
ncbi:hypothetical protein BCR43DRAFT_152100 [Syncephalastrum racemosum]|uniref:Uncharacterized protein n=1 Tax=Syncephalastrum racemosum TaxID=13706 RepID=A0A1X2HN13_SYNRA|nr:hypothetical protein BCR43DRAFT_152100 [Syncephalastrum racemosum]